MTLLQCHVFLAVCNQRSFTKAGEVLNMTQSAVSQAISNLEDELGVTLLHRSRQGIAITHIGERVLSHVREIIRHEECLREEASLAAGVEAGTLRIASIPSASGLLPGLLATFKARYPNVQQVLFDGSTDEIYSWLESHVIDVAFVTLPIAGLDVIELLEDQLLLFLPVSHPLAGQESISLDDVVGEPFILPKGDSEHVIRGAFRSRSLTPNVEFEVRDTATILAMVQEGIGVTILPEMAIPKSLPNVQNVCIRPNITRQVGLAVRNMAGISPICADFLLHAKDYVQR
ncbi:LysR family transcriptional regulator [Alicyclobacillus fastidiosus]|uniref:LysR family transcriptional regulator n=1 Tax=Alicyclobacillus fastidiosus TaxID=392011 RepID=A0ABV5ABU7_9BACL|nr:LysR family transcriptional regulator [Alicyclobacillus fastidiosus]WEH10310.1 LysR family transcriptional regulator [Alicyclobacillus fastidiosus]